ncbi:Coenzyme F420 hydrogenase/dehydrogenase, beta subunit C-terminal domain [Litchfieldia alkalitelluris]|uniref:Coenzyme F420 hydrogenase/dehydrogenase, beta subunit C-terminal domain n=1 Tax=Litchfieldia alkalitelluris TaxID=304268 RepID=UPI00099650DC|nr:Coenzyme F420 hydrogenase/dehydrogenase, beta subunit C-terminal domain [Litchfieldia alkalitelluris]
MNEKVKELIDTVISNDYCIGCGACASLESSPFTMKIDGDGKYRAFLNEGDQTEKVKGNALAVCPFSNDSKNETDIGKAVFGDSNDTSFNEFTGFYIKNYAGYVKEGEFRKRGSSGGMGNWIAAQLLNANLVDGIIHVKSAHGTDNNMLFEYQISYNENELSKGAKSKYYPIEMSKIIKFVTENEGRYALIGIPCYIKSIRLLADQNELIKERIKYSIGLVCGHLKSDMFAKSMGWEMGIEPDKLTSIDFRKKLVDRPANDYGVEVQGEKDGQEVVLSSPTNELYTTNWGHGLFKYNACEFCDDVLAETADVTIGDAWLPKYSKDSMGTNIIVVRNPVIQKILEENKASTIHIEEISPEKVYQSQAGGFRHRRDGLSYRLYLKDKNNEWRPNKRVEPSHKHTSKRKNIYKKRTFLSQESFKAYKLAEKEEDFAAFIKYMDPIIKDYDKTVAPSVARRILGKLKREVFKLVKK